MSTVFCFDYFKSFVRVVSSVVEVESREVVPTLTALQSPYPYPLLVQAQTPPTSSPNATISFLSFLKSERLEHQDELSQTGGVDSTKNPCERSKIRIES